MPRLAAENTLPSFALALDAGADGLELDVHVTADGAVVVHHDPALADGTPIASTSLGDLRRRASPGTGLPTLDDVCVLVAARAELFVELKGTGIEQAVLAVLAAYGGAYALHSFDHAMIARIRTLAPAVRTGILFDDMVPDLRTLVATTGARDIWPHAPLVTAALVEHAHDLGARTIPWTVNTSAEAARLIALGVDGLCGDDVRLFPPR